MFVAILSILLAIRWGQSEEHMREGHTALVIRSNVQNYENSIPVGIGNFTELVQKSKIFIDNTLFCKDILESTPNFLTILSPDQWGRTMLLTMLKAFLEIPVDQLGQPIKPKNSTTNFKLFTTGKYLNEYGVPAALKSRLLIASSKFIISNYLAKCPVIYVSFKNVTGRNKKDVRDELASAIQKAFEEHEYMKTVLRKNSGDNLYNLKLFQKYLAMVTLSELNLKEILKSLDFLGKILGKHVGRKSFLLIDDFDTPLHNGLRHGKFRKQDEKDIYEAFQEFQSFLMHGGHFEKVIMMGTFGCKFKMHNSFHRVDILNEKNYGNVTSVTPLREYFGFKQSHVEFLFKKHNLTGYLEKAKRWYNGYETSISNESFYNPASVVQFLHHKQFACYRPPEGKFPDFIERELKSSSIRLVDLGSLLANNTESKVIQWLYHDDKDFFFGGTWHSESMRMFYKYLRIEFCITINYPNYPPKPSLNYECTLLVSNWLRSYYIKKYNIDEQLVNNASIALRDFIFLNGSIEAFNTSLEQLLNKAQESQNIDAQILYSIMLEMKCISGFEIFISHNILYIREMNKAIVINLHYDNATRQTAHKIAEYSLQQEKINFPQLQTAQSIFINLFANQSQSIDILTIPVSF